MPIEFYKTLHIFGVFAVVLTLGGIGVQMMNGGSWNHPSRRKLAIIHGIGLLAALIGGFGLLGKMGYMADFPLWAGAKLAIWLWMGAVIALFKRKPQRAQALWVAVLLLATAAAWLAIYKPF